VEIKYSTKPPRGRVGDETFLHLGSGLLPLTSGTELDGQAGDQIKIQPVPLHFQHPSTAAQIHGHTSTANLPASTPTMKLQQYVNSFTDPLRAEDTTPLFRLLDIRHKVARGLKDSVGFIDVSARRGQQWRQRLMLRTNDSNIPDIPCPNRGTR